MLLNWVILLNRWRCLKSRATTRNVWAYVKSPYHALYNTLTVSKQIHSNKQENNRISDANFIKYERNSNFIVKQL